MSDTPIVDAVWRKYGPLVDAYSMAHTLNACRGLERRLAEVTAERDALQDAAATLIVRLPERMESILRGMHEDDVIPLHDAIEAVRAALRGKEGAK